MTFIIGQRWISNAESQLGLGFITAVNSRHISINFPAAMEERLYTSENAPLSRIIYKEGETVRTLDQRQVTITGITEIQGLIRYSGLDDNGELVEIPEIALDCYIKIVTPQQRLFTDQIDKLRSFRLRIDTLNHFARLQQSNVRGLLGSRTNHLPHQVYIANEIARRYAPRVLLADEVGLGKTIEAGMIVHYQLHTGRANRVLIVVPNTLIHQWLVEMIRRFNLYFSIFDESRFELADEEEEQTQNENLFETEQLVICSQEFLLNNEEARQQACSTNWDLLVVDEAHHLHWSPEEQSPEYSCIEQLSKQSSGLLLLTATPEQAGIKSHFARLRLLDPSRFYDFEQFASQEKGFEALNTFVKRLIDYKEANNTDELSSELAADLEKFYPGSRVSSISDTISYLLDRHGTGRVLFRNTRKAVGGFPERYLNYYPLAQPAESYLTSLYPEQIKADEQWLTNDPRVEWLANILMDLSPEKVLVICSQTETAILLEQYLKLKTGLRCSSFHEGLSIIERDKAAAYFSEEENGAQALICSEIGSEGRNFQFSHHLVLFDLPLNPDLLEQRIGRLDRIGQRHDIEIHVPYIKDTAQERLFRWYHEGINQFEKSCPAGFSIYETFESRLLHALNQECYEESSNAFEALVSETAIHSKKLLQALEEGRDRLLELHSCNRPVAEDLIQAIEAEESSLELENYMSQVFHEYGVEHEYHSEYSEILRPSNHMKTEHFPGLDEDGISVTWSRSKALVREDLEFLSWEHPMVCEVMDMILTGETGNASIATIAVKALPAGTLFLETFHTINCAAPKWLQLDKFLPSTPIRHLVDVTGKNLSNVLSYPQLNGMCDKIKRHMSQAIIKQVRGDIETMLDFSDKEAESKMAEIILQAKSLMQESISYELDRLLDLQKINALIRQDEIAFLETQIIDSEHHLNHASIKLEAIRLIINFPPE